MTPPPTVPRDEDGVPVLRVRRAYRCKNKDCANRVFLPPHAPDETPRCTEHGPMRREPNQKYLGQPTPV